MRLAALLLQLAAAPLLFAVSPRIAFERVLPAAHDIGVHCDVAIVHAIGDSAKIETFIDYFIKLKRTEAGRYQRSLEDSGEAAQGDEPSTWEQNEYFDFF